MFRCVEIDRTNSIPAPSLTNSKAFLSYDCEVILANKVNNLAILPFRIYFLKGLKYVECRLTMTVIESVYIKTVHLYK